MSSGSSDQKTDQVFKSLLSFKISFLIVFLLIAVTDPTGNVISFIQEYNETFGDQHPTFYPGTYSQVLNEAKKDLKFLLAYLHCKDHQDTNKFCRQTLCNPQVIEFINSNCLMWACSVNSLEGYRVSQALRENTYPFLAIIVQREFRMTVVGRYTGNISVAILKSIFNDLFMISFTELKDLLNQMP